MSQWEQRREEEPRTSARRFARRVLWSLPAPVKHGLSAAYGSWKRSAEPVDEVIKFPPDLIDREALRSFLLDTEVPDSDYVEECGYLWHALERFRITLAITPELPPDAMVLELGANPYFFTRMLLRRGMNVTCANWFGENANVGTRGTQYIGDARTGDRLAIDFDHFDIERGRFPYADETFDLVYFCEILEHLPLDPVNALVEIHRVLKKPEGVLVISTPNPVRSENLNKMIRGENVYEPISGYGVHGRHNREYTCEELRTLFEELGYDHMRTFTADVSWAQAEAADWFPGVEPSNRGEYVFAVARAVGKERWRYPSWLYQSRHALWRVVAPDVVVGQNDDLQTDGFSEREAVDGRDVRWLDEGREGRVLVSSKFDGPGFLRIAGLMSSHADPPLTLRVRLGDQELTQELTHEIPSGSDWFTLELPIHVYPIDQVVYLGTAGTTQPIEAGEGDRDRGPGLAVSSVALVPGSISGNCRTSH